MADGGAKDTRTSTERKGQPIATGVLAYFPKTLAALSEVSRRGNDKHNPGEPLHHDPDKSTDEADCCVRHIVDALEADKLGIPGGVMALNEDGNPHLLTGLWRLAMWCERVLNGDERWRTVAGPAEEDFKAGRFRFESCEVSVVLNRETANVPHSPEFFEQMKTCREAYKRLAMAFAAVLPAGVAVLDIGCGTGHQSASLARLGFKVFGVDPLVDPKDVEQVEGFTFFKHVDLIGGPPLVDLYPAVICTEVAEHVYPERADALVDAICSAARDRIIFSAARPGQEWEGHVNLQPPEYWLAKFAARGWRVAVGLTDELRLRMRMLRAQHCGAADNFYVFVR